MFSIGSTAPVCLVVLSPRLAASTASLEASSALCWPARRGKRISRARYAFRRATFGLRDSVEGLRRRGSTAMPIVGANLRGMPASCAGVFLVLGGLLACLLACGRGEEGCCRTFSSASEKPRPARTRRLYLRVGQRTMGRSLSTGRGATAAAFWRRALRRRDLRPG